MIALLEASMKLLLLSLAMFAALPALADPPEAYGEDAGLDDEGPVKRNFDGLTPGKTMRKVLPWPGSLSTSIWPP